MDASNIQSYTHGADYGYSSDSDTGSSSSQRPYRALYPGGQPLAQAASGTAAVGTQAQVLDLLKARAAALATVQDEAMRTSAFDTLLSSVYEHDEQHRAGAMHLLLAQLPGLLQQSRRDALSNLLLLCADVPILARPGLYAALAQNIICLPMAHRGPALRDIAAVTRGIAAQYREQPLLVISEAISILPDAQAQKTAYQLLRRLLEDTPAPVQLAAMETLAQVNWLDPLQRMESAKASLTALLQTPNSHCAPLLALLVDGLPKIPDPTVPSSSISCWVVQTV